MRLDRAVYARGLARSRSHAQQLIAGGVVLVDGQVETKASHPVAADAIVTLADSADGYVSRAAHKLAGAFERFVPRGLEVDGRTALDAGASTGGFTQVLLERGAVHVTAIDVGHGQLAAEISEDPRVTAVEGFNIRDLTPDSPGAGAQLVVGDLSFISLTLAIPPLVAAAAPDADFVLLIKPQFELSRSALDKHGVVTKPERRTEAVRRVCDAILAAGLDVVALEPSVLPGPSGNVEFFVWARRTWQARNAAASPALSPEELDAAIAALHEGRP